MIVSEHSCSCLPVQRCTCNRAHMRTRTTYTTCAYNLVHNGQISAHDCMGYIRSMLKCNGCGKTEKSLTGAREACALLDRLESLSREELRARNELGNTYAWLSNVTEVPENARFREGVFDKTLWLLPTSDKKALSEIRK